MSSKRFTVATIAIFTASEQTHCALVVCDSEWVIVVLHRAFTIFTKVDTALFLLLGWCHVKLLYMTETAVCNKKSRRSGLETSGSYQRLDHWASFPVELLTGTLLDQ